MNIRSVRRLAAVPVLALTVGFTAGCNDVTDAEVEDPLVGDFTAQEAVFTDNDDPNNTFDVIDADGALDLEFREDGTFQSDLAIPDRDLVTTTGTFTMNGDELMLTENGSTRAVLIDRTGNDLLVDDAGATFDFGAGDTGATLNARFEQR